MFCTKTGKANEKQAEMKTYDIPVTFMFYGTCHIPAKSLGEAIRLAQSPCTPLPSVRDYVSDSFQVEDRRTVMVANGWDFESLDVLENLPRDVIETEVKRRIDGEAASDADMAELDTEVLVAFLRDYYDYDVTIA